MPVSGPKCVAEIVFGRSGIARDFFFDEIDDPLQQLRLGMLANPLGSLFCRRSTSPTNASKGSLKAG